MGRLRCLEEETQFSSKILFEAADISERLGERVKVRAAVGVIRDLGGLVFVVLNTNSGPIQATFYEDKWMQNFTAGDFVEVTGLIVQNSEVKSGYEIQAESALNVMEGSKLSADKALLAYRGQIIASVERVLSERYGHRLTSGPALPDLEAVIPYVLEGSGVYLATNEFSHYLAASTGLISMQTLAYELGLIVNKMGIVEGASVPPIISKEDLRRRQREEWGYQPPISTAFVEEELRNIDHLIQGDLGEKWAMVVDAGPLQREFTLVRDGRIVSTGGIIMNDGVSVCGHMTLNIDALVAERFEGHGYFSTYGALDLVSAHDLDQPFTMTSFLRGGWGLGAEGISERAERVSNDEDAEMQEIISEASSLDSSQSLLERVLPIFRMSMEDAIFILDLLPDRKKSVLRMTEGEMVPYLWSLLGHDQVRVILSSSELKKRVVKLVESGLITDYSQLKFIDENAFQLIEELEAIYLKFVDAPLLLGQIERGLGFVRGGDVTAMDMTYVRSFLETGNEEKLSHMQKREKDFVKRKFERAQQASVKQWKKFVKKLLASSPNAFSTVLNTLKVFVDEERTYQLSPSAVDEVWSAVEGHMHTPMMFRLHLHFSEDEEGLMNFQDQLRNQFRHIHMNKELDEDELSQDFYRLLDSLGLTSLFPGRPGVYTELLHYFYRPINMGYQRLVEHSQSVNGHVDHVEDLASLSGTEDWEGDLACFSFEVASLEKAESEILQIYPSKSRVSYFAKATAGICTLNDQELFERSDHFHFNLVDGNSGIAVGNVQAYVLEDGGQRRLLLRAINPTETYLNKVDPEDALRVIIRAAQSFARATGFDSVCLSESMGVWHAASSRESIKAILHFIYENLQAVELDKPFCIYNYGGEAKAIGTVYTIN